nr:DciA family protein [Arthrobacter roseus]
MLNRMREASVARGNTRTPAGRRRHPTKGSRQGRNGGVAAGEYVGRDPQGLGTVFNRLLGERGWKSPVAVGSVLSRWDELVGPDVAAHCRPESFENNTVQVRCDSTTWATQLRLLRTSLLHRFEKELGSGVVTVIDVLGPTAPNWRRGKRSVNGRGPRDTYG